MTTAAARPRHLDVADVAKLLRKRLRADFPGIKFSVRAQRSSMWCSLNVSWTDGPTERRVRESVTPFRGGRFEGLTDCAYGADSWYCPEHGARTAETYGCDVADNNRVHESRCCARAELMSFGADAVNVSRKLSPEFAADLRTRVLVEFEPEALTEGVDVEVWRLSCKTER